MVEKKLNIGLFLDTWFPMVDGVINVVDNYAKRLCKFANVTVFAPNSGKVENINSLPYKLVRCKSMNVIGLDYVLPLPFLDKNFKRELNKANLDIIHIHSPFTIGKMATTFGNKNNIPVVATFHSQFKKDFYKATKSKTITNILLKKIMKVFNQADECWAVNKEIADVFKSYGYVKEAKIYNNGTDLFPIENREEVFKEINQQFNLKEDEKVFLFVGRLTVLKNILFIVDALKKVKDLGYNFKMLFVGSGQDENLLKNKIKELNLNDEVILCGRITNRETIKGLYARAYAFLFPSLYDASSLVQIEAASQGTPTMFVKGAVTAGTVTNEVDGFIVENNVDAFANKIVQLLNDENYRNKIGENAKQNLYKNWDDIAKKVYEDYINLINQYKY